MPRLHRGRSIIGFGAAVAFSIMGMFQQRNRAVLGFVSTAIDSHAQRAFVTASGFGLIVLDSRSGQLLHVEPAAHGMGNIVVAVDEPLGQAFVTAAALGSGGLPSGAGTVTMVETRTGRIVRSIAVGQIPGYLAVDPVAHRVLVSNQGDDSVSILDARSGAHLHRVPAVAWPATIALDTRHGRAFVLGRTADHQTNAMTVLDTRTGAIVRTLPPIGVASGNLTAAALDERSGHLFIVNDGSVFSIAPKRPSLEMIDAQTERHLRRIAVGDFPRALQLDAQGRRLYLTVEFDTVRVVDVQTGRVIDSITIPTPLGASSVQNIALHAQANRLFVSGFEAGVTMLDMRTGAILRRLPQLFGTLDLALDERAERLFAPGRFDIGVVDARTGALLQTISADEIARFSQ